MRLLIACTLAAFPIGAAADELVLKDGKKIEWRILKDAGDVYEVETEKGDKLTVKKSDVKKIGPAEPQSPLTGATFSFKGGTTVVDFMKRGFNFQEDAIQGCWKMAGPGALLVDNTLPGTPTSLRLSVPNLPEEYDVTVTAERKEGIDDLYIGLVVGGKQVMVDLDPYQHGMSGIALIDGKGPDQNGTGTTGKIFSSEKGAKPRTVVCMVRNQGIVVTVDGKDLIAWKADYDKVSIPPANGMPGNKVSLFIGTWKGAAVRSSSFQITQLKVSYKK